MADDFEMKRVKQLMSEKDAIEKEIKQFKDILDSEKDVGMNGNLVDVEGYPRNDIDVHAVRIARNKIICLQNDHKDIMKQIEEGLHKIHAAAKAEKTTETDRPKQDDSLQPFLKVDSVKEGSPASKAGLEKDDLILKFGSLTQTNYRELKNVAVVVQHSKGISMQVTVLRKDQKVNLSLTPNVWSGQGLLGCHVVPITT